MYKDLALITEEELYTFIAIYKKVEARWKERHPYHKNTMLGLGISTDDSSIEAFFREDLLASCASFDSSGVYSKEDDLSEFVLEQKLKEDLRRRERRFQEYLKLKSEFEQ